MAVIGIDIGVLSTKLASVGRDGLKTIVNEIAERTTPTLVSFTDKERLVGNFAQSSLKSNLDTTAKNFTHLLGVTNDETEKTLVEYESSYSFVPIVPSEDAGCVAYELGNNRKYTAVEILIPFLRKLKSIAESDLGIPVSKCVISTPLWFAEVHRKALYDACELSNLHCLKAIPHSHATALDYGLFRRNSIEENKVIRVAFIDIGYSQCTVTVVEYTKSSFTIIKSVENFSLGARAMDQILVNYLVSVFNKKHNCDIAKSKKAMLMLTQTVEKSRKILSANKETQVYMECFYNDYDLEEHITRDLFEELCVDYEKNLIQLIVNTIGENLIKDNKYIDNIELIGGTTRTPFIIEAIDKVFSKSCYRTLGDECTARGCAIQAAILDPRFRVSAYELRYKNQRPLSLIPFTALNGSIYDEKLNEIKFEVYDNISLVNIIPVDQVMGQNYQKVFILPPPGNVTSVNFRLVSILPIGDYSIIIPPDVQKASTESPSMCRFKVKIDINTDLLVSISATFTQEIKTTEMIKEKVPKLDDEKNPIEGEFEEIERPETKSVYRTTKLDINVTRPNGYYSIEDVKRISERELNELSNDKQTQRLYTIRNDILGLCFKLRTLANEPGEYAPFISEEHKIEFVKLSTDCEEFAEYNMDAQLKDFEECYNKLHNLWDPIDEQYRSSIKSEADKLEQQTTQSNNDTNVQSQESSEIDVTVNENSIDMSEQQRDTEEAVGKK